MCICLNTIPYRRGTDGQTDGQTEMVKHKNNIALCMLCTLTRDKMTAKSNKTDVHGCAKKCAVVVISLLIVIIAK